MTTDFDTRISLVIDSLNSRSLPAILVLNPSNIKFLTGFSGSNSCLLITTQKLYFFTDSRYLEDSKNKFSSWIVEKYSRDFKEIHQALYELNIHKIGYESKKISQFDFENLSFNSMEIEFVKSDGLIEEIRSVKDVCELHQINQAIEFGWSVAFPEWDDKITDVADAVLKYGRLFTIQSILNSTEHSKLKIELKRKMYG